MGGVHRAVQAGQALQGRDRHRSVVRCVGDRGGHPVLLRRHRQQGVLRGDALLLLRPAPRGRRRGAVMAARPQRLLHALQNPADTDDDREGRFRIQCMPYR